MHILVSKPGAPATLGLPCPTPTTSPATFGPSVRRRQLRATTFHVHPSLPHRSSPDADAAFHEAFRVWECRRASAVACARAWREERTPIAGLLDRLGEVTRIYEEADAELQALHEAARKRSRSDGAR